MALGRTSQWLANQGVLTVVADLAAPETSQPEFRQDRFAGIVHVVNAAGLLQGTPASMAAVHETAPKAIYAALKDAKSGVLISAVGIDANTPFAVARRAGERVAQEAPFQMTILRPGLVIGEGSYGGTSLGRALAACPLRTPVIGEGRQSMNPLHADDLAAFVIEALRHPRPEVPVEVGGPQIVSQTEYLMSLRRWMGLRGQPVISVPVPLALAIGRVGEALSLGPISRASVRQLVHGVEAPTDSPFKHCARGFDETLAARPVATQDLWHGRLYLLRPLIRLTLACLWLISGLLGLFLSPESFLPALVGSGIADLPLLVIARAGGLADLAIALALLRGWRLKTMALVQLALVGVYTMGLTVLAPGLWLDPFGGLLKNIVVLALILIHRVLEQER